jgi:uncharacterized LabA/DUF88 family protein
MAKVMIYMDNSNFYKTARQKYPQIRIDYRRLVDFLLNGREKAEVKIYGSERNPPLAEQSNFYKFLRKCGYLITILPLKRVGASFEEKGVDIALGMDMLIDGFKNHFDCAVLVSGDRDYARLIERVRRECGWSVEVAFFEFGLSEELRLSAQKFINLSEHIEQIRQ